MPIIEITSLEHPGVEVYASLTDRRLRLAGNEAPNGIFIAESPKVITSAIEAGYTPLSMLAERRHIDGDAAPIVARFPNIPVYTGERNQLASLTGYVLTRGVLCAMHRRVLPTVEAICRDARRVVVIDSVSDATNIGSIFRSAAALGFDAVLLTPRACDPLNRRALRVSMGTALRVPWTWLTAPVGSLRSLGFKTVALALADNSTTLDDPALNSEQRIALILGEEGYGLDATVIDDSDYVVRIPMHYGIDSLNVAATAAIACWQLRPTPYRQ
ncbi:MAG: TrmH family RNA methyltransferase [Muribaculaceae bacterium]